MGEVVDMLKDFTIALEGTDENSPMLASAYESLGELLIAKARMIKSMGALIVRIGPSPQT